MKIITQKKNQISNGEMAHQLQISNSKQKHFFYFVCYFSTCGEKVWDKQEYCLDLEQYRKKDKSTNPGENSFWLIRLNFFFNLQRSFNIVLNEIPSINVIILQNRHFKIVFNQFLLIGLHIKRKKDIKNIQQREQTSLKHGNCAKKPVNYD